MRRSVCNVAPRGSSWLARPASPASAAPKRRRSSSRSGGVATGAVGRRDRGRGREEPASRHADEPQIARYPERVVVGRVLDGIQPRLWIHEPGRGTNPAVLPGHARDLDARCSRRTGSRGRGRASCCCCWHMSHGSHRCRAAPRRAVACWPPDECGRRMEREFAGAGRAAAADRDHHDHHQLTIATHPLTWVPRQFPTHSGRPFRPFGCRRDPESHPGPVRILPGASSSSLPSRSARAGLAPTAPPPPRHGRPRRDPRPGRSRDDERRCGAGRRGRRDGDHDGRDRQHHHPPGRGAHQRPGRLHRRPGGARHAGRRVAAAGRRPPPPRDPGHPAAQPHRRREPHCGGCTCSPAAPAAPPPSLPAV